MKKDDEKVKRLAKKRRKVYGKNEIMGSGLVELRWHILINFPFPPSNFLIDFSKEFRILFYLCRWASLHSQTDQSSGIIWVPSATRVLFFQRSLTFVLKDNNFNDKCCFWRMQKELRTYCGSSKQQTERIFKSRFCEIEGGNDFKNEILHTFRQHFQGVKGKLMDNSNIASRSLKCFVNWF